MLSVIIHPLVSLLWDLICALLIKKTSSYYTLSCNATWLENYRHITFANFLKKNWWKFALHSDGNPTNVVFTAYSAAHLELKLCLQGFILLCHCTVRSKETSQTCLDHIWASHICLSRPGQMLDAHYNIVIEPNYTVSSPLRNIEHYNCSVIHMLACLGLIFPGWAVTAKNVCVFFFCYTSRKVCIIVLPEHRAGLAGQDPASPHSGPNRRTCAWAAESHSPPLPALWTFCCGPASSLPNQYTHSVTHSCAEMKRHLLYKDVARGGYWWWN